MSREEQMPDNNNPATDAPLAGMRVLELSNGKTDMAGRLLADLGAEVILLESPGGAAVRQMPPMHEGQSLFFATHHANKGSVCVALDTVEGQRRLHALAAECDLLIDGLPPGTLERFGSGAIQLRADNPSLTVLSVSDFGLTGPYREYRASHAVHTAMAGVLSRSGLPGEVPLLPPASICWESASIQAAFVALLGYWQRLRRGHGDHLDFSIHEAVAQIFDPGLGATGSANGGRSALDTTPPGRPHPLPLYAIIGCKDGFVRICVLNPRQWEAMSEWLGPRHPFLDPSYAQIGKRAAEADQINAHIAKLFAGYTASELVAQAQARGIPLAALLTPAQVLCDEHFLARKAFIPFEVQQGVTGLVPSGYFEVDGVRFGIRRPAPGLNDTSGFSTPRFLPRGLATTAAVDGRAFPLQGVRVLDLGIIVAGAEAGRLLADQGADVIKIENRAYPDGGRQSVLGDAMTPSVALGHRNKRSFGVNLRSEQGRRLFKRLVEQADVLLSNFKPGTLDTLGLGANVLSAINPGLVMMDSSALGNNGPRSRSLGYGPLVRAATGLSSLWRYPEIKESFSDGVTVYPDHVAGRVAALGVLALLVRRERTGAGGRVSISQAEIFLNANSEHFLRESLSPGSFVAHGNLSEDRVPEGVYPCKGEDQWCVISVCDDDQWLRFVRLAKLESAMGDTSFSTLEGRRERRQQIDRSVSEFTSRYTPRDLAAVLQAAGIPAGFMQRLSEYRTDPHFQARGFIQMLEHPGLPLPLPAENRIVHSLYMRDPQTRPAPFQGEHTREVAKELLALNDEQIDAFVDTGDLEIAAKTTSTTLPAS